MKFTQITLHPIVHKLMVEMGLLDRPATPDEIVKIVQAVLAEAEGRKAEPLAPKLVVPEDPDEASAKQALFTIYRPWLLDERLREIPGCDCWTRPYLKKPCIRIKARFARQDEVREVLAQFGVCPPHPKRPPTGISRPGKYKFKMTLRLPEDWRLSSEP